MQPSVTYEGIREEYPPILTLRSDKSICQIALHGAHVLSFIPAESKDLLWISDQAHYREGKAIRGGIPICWPWFGAHPSEDSKPSHGFARISTWEVVRTGTEEGNPYAVLALTTSAETKQLFDYDFLLELKVVASESLQVSLTTTNQDTRSFVITEALHSYFDIADITKVRLSGLEMKSYIDQLQHNHRFRQEGPVTIDREVDRIYQNGDACRIDNPLGIYSVTPTGSRSTVVWNPWIDKARRLSDFSDEAYRRMLCVETANIGDDRVTIAPGESHTIRVTIKKEE